MTKSVTDSGVTDSELSDDLLTLRGVQWIMGTKDDPYALLLRGASDDPHELGLRIRQRGPLYLSHAGVWVTADHSLAEAILGDPRLSPRPPGRPEAKAEAEADPMPWDFPALRDVLPLDEAFVSMDRGDYDALPPVTYDGAAVLQLYRRHAGLLDGGFDLLADYALGTAATVAALALGVPAEDHGRFTGLCARFAGLLDATTCPPQLAAARRLTATISQVREMLRPDTLVAGMLTAAVGVELTANLTGNAMAALLDNPGQWRLLRDDPELAPAAVEETLRYLPPVRLRSLFARDHLELAGKRVETGQEVVLVVEAAYRDPDVYPAPGRFDIKRMPAAGLLEGLQLGPVLPLARSGAAAALQAIATEIPEIRITGPVLRRLRSPVTAGILQFPVSTK